VGVLGFLSRRRGPCHKTSQADHGGGHRVNSALSFGEKKLHKGLELRALGDLGGGGAGGGAGAATIVWGLAKDSGCKRKKVIAYTEG